MFIRIFPTKHFPKYERFLDHSPNLSIYRQLYNFLYANRFLQNGPLSSAVIDGSSLQRRRGLHHPDNYEQTLSKQKETKPKGSGQDNSNDQQEEIVLTGDDLVVEYVERLSRALAVRAELPSHLSARIN